MDLNDVALSEADSDAVDRLVSRTSFNRDEAEAIVRFANVEHGDRDPSQIRSYVSNGEEDSIEDGFTAAECDQLRRDMGRASRPTTVIDAYPNKHPSVIFRHATGRCNHDGDEDPVTSPRIQPDECREMRVDFQTGDTVEDIRANYNRSANAVVRHVFGRCEHEFEHKRNGKELSTTTCVRMRSSFRENKSAAIADIARAFIVGTSTAHRHLTGACGHRDDVEDPIIRVGSADIDERECDLLRASYGKDTTPGDLAGAFDRDASAVRKHVFGRCRHGETSFEPDRATITPGICKAIRHEHRRRGVESVAAIIDRLGVTKGTYYYHLYGRCGHDHDVEPVERRA